MDHPSVSHPCWLILGLLADGGSAGAWPNEERSAPARRSERRTAQHLALLYICFKKNLRRPILGHKRKLLEQADLAAKDPKAQGTACQKACNFQCLHIWRPGWPRKRKRQTARTAKSNIHSCFLAARRNSLGPDSARVIRPKLWSQGSTTAVRQLILHPQSCIESAELIHLATP